MSPESAYEKIKDSGPFDDPYISWYPHRWHWFEFEPGKFCLALSPWRTSPTLYKQFLKP